MMIFDEVSDSDMFPASLLALLTGASAPKQDSDNPEPCATVRLLSDLRTGDLFQFVERGNLADWGPCVVSCKAMARGIMQVQNLMTGAICMFSLTGEREVEALTGETVLAKDAREIEITPTRQVRFHYGDGSPVSGMLNSLFNDLLDAQQERLVTGQPMVTPQEILADFDEGRLTIEGPDESVARETLETIASDRVGLTYLTVLAADRACTAYPNGDATFTEYLAAL